MYVNEKFEAFRTRMIGKKIAVIGMGISNTPLIRYLINLKSEITVFDKRDEDKFIKFSDLTDLVKKEKKNIIFVGNASKTCYNLSSEYLSCDSKFYEKEVDSDFVGQAALDHFYSNDYSLSANYLKKTRAENLKNV